MIASKLGECFNVIRFPILHNLAKRLRYLNNQRPVIKNLENLSQNWVFANDDRCGICDLFVSRTCFISEIVSHTGQTNTRSRVIYEI